VLGQQWHVTALPPDSAQDPARAQAVARALRREPLAVNSDNGACTVALALSGATAEARRDAGLPLAAAPLDLDAHDSWFRTHFRDDGLDPSGTLVLHGIATVADVWLNGLWLGRTNNMFMQWETNVSALLLEQNELVICARAMALLLKPRRPPARWRARLLASQEWRGHRPTQLGRMNGFGPPTPRSVRGAQSSFVAPPQFPCSRCRCVHMCALR
jgi:hypothetical protein